MNSLRLISRSAPGCALFRTSNVYVSSVANPNATEEPTAWMIRYERAVMRRKTKKLDPQAQVWDRIDPHICDPVMTTVDYKKVTERSNFTDIFGDTLGSDDYKKWMNVNHAAKILGIPREEIPGIAPGEVMDHYQGFLKKVGRLSPEGFAQAAAAAEVLVDYTSSDLFRRETKAHYAKVIAEERRKLNVEVTSIWNDKFGYVLWFYAIFFFGGSCILVLAMMLMPGENSMSTEKLSTQAKKVFKGSFTWMYSKEKEKPPAEPERSPNVYVDKSIVGSHVEISAGMKKGHTEMPSCDPRYEALVADEAVALHREEEKIAELLGKKG